MSEDNRVRIEVVWDGDDLELKAMGAIMEVFRRAKGEGLSVDAICRIAEYFADRIPRAPTIPIRHPTTGGEE